MVITLVSCPSLRVGWNEAITMCAVQISAKPDHDLYKLLLFEPETKACLVVRHGASAVLPIIAIPRWARATEELQAAVKRRWGYSAFVLDVFHDAVSSAPVVAAELVAGSTPFKHCKRESWSDFESVRGELSEKQMRLGEGLLAGEISNPRSFARLGWIDDALGWLQSVTGTPYTRSDTRIEQVNSLPDYALLRIAQEGRPSIWLKVTPESSSGEYAITRHLIHLFPEYLPPLLAARDDWSAWLSADVGSPLSANLTRPEMMLCIGRRLAGLELASSEYVPKLLFAGCTDQRIVALPAGIRRLIPYLEEAIATTTQSAQRPTTRRRLRVIADLLEAICSRLEVLRVPDVLVHNDISPENILCGKDDIVFSDWAEAGVGIPGATLGLIKRQLARAGCREAQLQRLVAEYHGIWRASLSDSIVQEMGGYTPLLVASSFLLSRQKWFTPEHRSDPDFQRFARSLGRQLDRAAMASETAHRLSA